MKIIVIDQNPEVIEAARNAGIEAILGDYFIESLKIPNHVLITASNPRFTMGGGIDYAFKEKYPFVVQYKQMKGGGMERIGNIVFAITVNDRLVADKETVKKALQFGVCTLLYNETLVTSGLGTGIGALSARDFGEILSEIQY